MYVNYLVFTYTGAELMLFQLRILGYLYLVYLGDGAQVSGLELRGQLAGVLLSPGRFQRVSLACQLGSRDLYPLRLPLLLAQRFIC